MLKGAFFLLIIIPTVICAFKISSYVLAAFLLVITTIFKALLSLTRKFFGAVPWIISAFCALSFTFFALGQQFFFSEDAKLLIAEKLPPRENIQSRSFSLLIIELTMVIREIIRKQFDGELF